MLSVVSTSLKLPCPCLIMSNSNFIAILFVNNREHYKDNRKSKLLLFHRDTSNKTEIMIKFQRAVIPSLDFMTVSIFGQFNRALTVNL